MAVPDGPRDGGGPSFFKSARWGEDFLRQALRAAKKSAYTLGLDGALAQPVRATES